MSQQCFPSLSVPRSPCPEFEKLVKVDKPEKSPPGTPQCTTTKDDGATPDYSISPLNSKERSNGTRNVATEVCKRMTGAHNGNTARILHGHDTPMRFICFSVSPRRQAFGEKQTNKKKSPHSGWGALGKHAADVGRGARAFKS